uniref:hypothetical protein n=1 Tax=Glaucosphaera vacuolata TaxID=38265 RepID=UPI001FCDAC03|nr:hypothetical protein MW444_pgp082 [Glaucosphaera vacuolata]UNJ18678.1 hypothetical protein [Glaucosphaera vacuolata]
MMARVIKLRPRVNLQYARVPWVHRDKNGNPTIIIDKACEMFSPPLFKEIQPKTILDHIRIRWFAHPLEGRPGRRPRPRVTKNVLRGRLKTKLYFKQYARIGRMKVKLEDGKLHKKKEVVPIIWKKGINIPLPKMFPKIGGNYRSPNFPTERQAILMQTLQDYPVFVVRNGFKELIIGYPQRFCKANFTNNRGTWKSNWYRWYHKYFLWEKDLALYSVGFFFFNPQDADMLKHTIYYKYIRTAKQYEIATHPAGLDYAYKLNRTSKRGLQFKFIPDLQEVLQLVKIHKYKVRLEFHPKQVFGRDYFQGQPIYILKSKLPNTDNNKKLIFTSLEAADRGWEVLKKEYEGSSLSKKPNLIVYNLESFLKDCEDGIEDPNFDLITNYDSYMFMERLNASRKSPFLNYWKGVNSKLFWVRLWMKRTILVFTKTKILVD